MLVDWVYSGHSPYTNGDGVFDDDGWPLDFINTLRGWNEMQEYCDHLDDEVCQTLSAIPDGMRLMIFQMIFRAQQTYLSD